MKTRESLVEATVELSALETELASLLTKHGDHSAIREAMERMGDMPKGRITYTTYPACNSNA